MAFFKWNVTQVLDISRRCSSKRGNIARAICPVVKNNNVQDYLEMVDLTSNSLHDQKHLATQWILWNNTHNLHNTAPALPIISTSCSTIVAPMPSTCTTHNHRIDCSVLYYMFIATGTTVRVDDWKLPQTGTLKDLRDKWMATYICATFGKWEWRVSA